MINSHIKSMVPNIEALEPEEEKELNQDAENDGEKVSLLDVGDRAREAP